MDRVEILKVMVVENPFQQCVVLVSLWNLVAQEIMTVTELVAVRMTMMAVMELQYLCFATEHTFNCHRVLK